MKDDRQGRIPYEHAKALYQKQQPEEIQQRINIPFNEEAGVFTFRLLGEDHGLSWPEGVLTNSRSEVVTSYVIGILVLRYFALGSFATPTGRKVTYKDIPDGSIYYPNFKKRTIDRLAKTFDRDPNLLDQDGKDPGLGDRSLEVELIDHVPVTYVCWEGDDEFAASANILFDESIKHYFNAEDLAVLPDLGIVWLEEKGNLPLDLGMYGG
ncbi:DUF3786 domain-containing protein [Alkalibacter rhizosphaerae]|uniref:DUF3786 domain-containing protein n=1 Tax=Alkalibacter rhizosphaerae TaxID=2815577 RepID=A0A974XDP9_9FIRM|nr:DUF3786 domain-containing protein [Alkalibacter rhizosphaerae]QSX07934.1 DUF3786 domain-containing protein [Alkalibacter rhizosphaerae]